MEFVIVKKRAQAFKQMLETIKDLSVTDTNISFSENGLIIKSMDVAHVSVIILDIEKSYFSNYNCTTPIVLGVNLNILTKLLKSISKLDTLVFLKHPAKDTLNISISNETRTQHFEIPLFEFISDELNIPNIDYKLVYRLDTDQFSNILSDISLVEGRDITITMGNKHIQLRSEGDIGKTNIRIDAEPFIKEGEANKDKDGKDDKDDKDNKDDKDKDKIAKCSIIKDGIQISSSFSLEHLKNVSKAKQFSRSGVLISLTDDFPLSICYPFGPNSHLRLYLAPKIPDN